MLWKRKTEKVAGETKVSPYTSVTYIGEDKSKSNKCVKFTTLLHGDKLEGKILKTITLEKSKSPLAKNVYILSVYRENGKILTKPYLKYVNESLCTKIEEPNLSGIPSKYFKYDWMVGDDETQRLKRIGSERALQEKNGG